MHLCKVFPGAAFATTSGVAVLHCFTCPVQFLPFSSLTVQTVCPVSRGKYAPVFSVGCCMNLDSMSGIPTELINALLLKRILTKNFRRYVMAEAHRWSMCAVTAIFGQRSIQPTGRGKS